MGFACMKNTILVGSKDSIEKEKKIPYLKLPKQGEKKMKGPSSWDLQEKGDNGKLGRGGRGRGDQIFIWKPRGEARKGKK